MHSEATREAERAHRVTVTAREATEICGVTEVISFDEETVVLDTVCGRLTLEGEGLHVQVLQLTSGVVTLSGRVDALAYESTSGSDRERRGNFFGKLFG